MIVTLTFELCHFDSTRNSKELCDTLSEKIGCGVWYDTFTTVNTEWEWLIEKLLKALHIIMRVQLLDCSQHILRVLPAFEDKMNIYRLGEKSPYTQTIRASDSVYTAQQSTAQHAVQSKMVVWQQCPR
jgi:hypothetical protein